MHVFLVSIANFENHYALHRQLTRSKYSTPNIFSLFWWTCQEPAEAGVTRLDQLKMKQAKADEEDDKKGRGRGRGRGGARGRGRGRGRGKGPEDQEKESDPPAETSTAKPKKTPAKTRNDAKESDWAAWGTADAWIGWTEGWDQESWAWDSYAWWEHQVASHELEQQHAGSSTTASASNPRKTESSDDKGTEKNDQNDKAEKKTPKEIKKDDKKKTSKETKKVEESQQEEKPTKRDKKQKAKDEDDAVSAKKCRKQEGHGAESVSKKRKKLQEPPAEEPVIEKVETLDPSKVMSPDANNKTVNKILNFMKGFEGMQKDAAEYAMRGRLLDFKACRMNVYWSRIAVGLHHRKQKVDFAYFKPRHADCPPQFLMAAAMKAAEIVATRLLGVMETKTTFARTCIFKANFMHMIDLI